MRGWFALLLLAVGCDDDGGDRAPVDSPIDEAAHAAFLPLSACAPCHARQVEAYRGTAMHYATSSPVFLAMQQALADATGGRFTSGGQDPDRCAHCHAPVGTVRGVFFAGDDFFGKLTTPDDGITCDLCHRITGPVGDGIANLAFRATPGAEKRGPFGDPVASRFHASTGEGATHLSSARFCGACHDVRLDQPDVATGEPFARLENLYTEWSESPWADADHPQNPLRGQSGIGGVHEGRRAWGEVVTCQDCHLSLYPARGFTDRVEYAEAFAGVDRATLDRKAHKLYPAGEAAEPDDGRAVPRRRVSTHAMVGASNAVLPFEGKVGVEPGCADARDAFGQPACVRQRRDAMLKAALTLDLSETPPTVEAGGEVDVRAWIENVGAGHGVPSGFSQEREVWVALTVTDEGSACVADADCADWVQPQRFVDDPDFACLVRGPDGQPDATLQPDDARTWRRRAREERSGACDAGRCVVYRSGYLIDRDGDGRVEDEDLRHELVEMDADAFVEACALPGPDADLRGLGVDEGLVIFTNQFQHLEVDAAQAPVEEPNARWLAPTAAPYLPGAEAPPVLDQDPAERRSLLATERALFERLRFRTARKGFGLTTVNPVAANRYFNGNSLRPFEPRLARYRVRLPPAVIGPLRVEARVRFRFFPPRLLRVLTVREAARGSKRVTEATLDDYVDIVDLAADAWSVTVE